ncbi:hypothetical protein [Microbulbifer epialgicus]|uniref:Uncharacterized protein n=1 Tax=Microbulbifer epialgicus TaxID=393907 RepID=A0ABV4P780_9GAMM
MKVLGAIPHCQPVADYEALLPWNIQLESVGMAEAAQLGAQRDRSAHLHTYRLTTLHFELQ